MIRAHEDDYLRRAVTAWQSHPDIDILGNVDAERLSIVSFTVRRPGGRYLHHDLVVAVLNDVFGIQSRGGCSCAGPYGHRLLGIDIERSHEFEREITHGCEGIKPGWVRVDFNYFISEAVFGFVVNAVAPHRRPRVAAGARVPLRRRERSLAAAKDGAVSPRCACPSCPMTRACSPIRATTTRRAESDLERYLAEAHGLMESLPEPGDDVAADRVSADFENLRWFELAEHLPELTAHPYAAHLYAAPGRRRRAVTSIRPTRLDPGRRDSRRAGGVRDSAQTTTVTTFAVVVNGSRTLVPPTLARQ